MPTGFDREGVAAPGFRNPLAAPRAEGDPAPREPQARKDDPAKLAPATPAKPQAGEGAKPPEQIAMSRRPSKAQLEIDEAKRNPGKEDIVFTMEESRQWAILKDRRVRFNIEDNPAKKGGAPGWCTHSRGVEAVKKHDAIIEREAKRKGVDPNLVRAIMYMENADGNPLNLNRLAEDFGMASSTLPMNIKPGMWAGLDGVKKEEFKNPEANIRAGVTLIKRIRDRLDDPTPAKIGSIWNFTGAEKVNEKGARIQKIYDKIEKDGFRAFEKAGKC
ncbi:MAG: lytic transglycosylase domain-containing protein [Proteobacteria bacterium]|nr:lytic transglycosylase domain-containing protein [Pseudomonadota bacterium]